MLPQKHLQLDMRIFLIGFMGSGKSHVGKRLADKMAYPFVDLDNWIEEKQQKSIRQLFEAIGEAAFRKIEQKALHDMAQFPSAIVACGGGTPCFFDNMHWMNANGITIYLQTSLDILAARLASAKAQRPLLKDLDENSLRQFISDKLAERSPFYQQASVIYEVSSNEEDIAANLVKHFSNIIGH